MSLRTFKEAAEYLRISTKTLRRHVNSGAIRYINVGRGTQRVHRVFAQSDLDEFTNSRRHRDVAVDQSAFRHRVRRGDGVRGPGWNGLTSFSERYAAKNEAKKKPK